MNKNLLLNWVENHSSSLSEKGYKIEEVADQKCSKSFVVDILANDVGGRICHWEPDIFEFQFHNMISGDVVLLETKKFQLESELSEYIDKVLVLFYA